jgi:hypothetical protein
MDMARRFIFIATIAAVALVSGTLAMPGQGRQVEAEPLPPAWALDLDVEDLVS